MYALFVFIALIPCAYCIPRSIYRERYEIAVFPNATDQWIATCYPVLDMLKLNGRHGAHNFTFSAAHSLHSITIDYAKAFFGVDLPEHNDIPTNNINITVPDKDGVLKNIPNISEISSSPAFDTFVKVLDKWDDQNFIYNGSNVLGNLLHEYHMQDIWVKTRKVADKFENISKGTCDCVLDFASNGVVRAMKSFFCSLKHDINATTLEHGHPPMPPITNLTTWNMWRNKTMDPMTSLEPAGLVWYCIMQKFSPCCETKTWNNQVYKRTGYGKCVSNCIYERDGKPYYFATGLDGDKDTICN